MIGCRGVLCVEDLVRAGLQGCSCQREMQVQRPWGWKEQGRFKQSRQSLCGWSIASKGHSFIEVVGDANWAKSWGYLLDHAGFGAPHCSTRPQKQVMSRIRPRHFIPMAPQLLPGARGWLEGKLGAPRRDGHICWARDEGGWTLAIAKESKEKHVGWRPRGKALLKQQHGVRTERNQGVTQASRLTEMGRTGAGQIPKRKGRQAPL